MTHPIDNQYRYGIVYNLDGKIVGFNLSHDVYVPITDIDIERALENYIVGIGIHKAEEETIVEILKKSQEGE